MSKKYKHNYTLGIETSCDETAIAVVKDGNKVVTEQISSQVNIMEKYGGVVPELSARQHIISLPILFNLCFKNRRELLKKITAIAVTKEPGLPPCLATGIAYAKGLGFGLKVPVIEGNHLTAHVCSVLIDNPEPPLKPQNWADKITFPHISLVVSGGHTTLFLVDSPTKTTLIAKTLDDAAGEAYDKVARLLGLGYPGGPVIEKLIDFHQKTKTEGCFLEKNPFTVPVTNDPYHFSFSGLKTAVRRLIFETFEKINKRQALSLDAEKIGKTLPHKIKAEIAYWFQETVIESLVQKTLNAATRANVELITITGGVAANKRLREKMAKEAAKEGIKIRYPPLKHCTDNAAMVACAGYYQFISQTGK